MTKTVIIKEKTKNLVCNPSMTFANDICIRFLHFSTSWLKYHLDYVMLIEFASSEGLFLLLFLENFSVKTIQPWNEMGID